MTGADWGKRVAGAAKRVGARSDASPDGLKTALVELDALLRHDVPLDVENAFRALRESELAIHSARRRRRLLTVGSSIPDLGTIGLPDVVRELASEIRAIDELLADELAVHNGSVADAEDWLVDHATYVIPRPHGRRGVRDQQLYSQRGLVRHRVLPLESGGYPVAPIIAETGDLAAIGRGDAPAVLGSALFDTVDLDMKPHGQGGFIVVGIDCGDMSVVDLQVERACLDGCLVAVWPELSVPPATLERIRSGFSGRALSPEPGNPPALVVAGSHHEPSNTGYRNVCTVLDGFGVDVLRYEKVNPYMNRTLGKEAIVPGTRLPVLVTDEALVAFAICKDFCDVGPNIPLGSLDVDYILVPSMGNDVTMRGHQANAKRHKVRYGSRTFVVQQHDPPDGPDVGSRRRFGYVLRPSAEPDAPGLGELAQSVTWVSSA